MNETTLLRKNKEQQCSSNAVRVPAYVFNSISVIDVTYTLRVYQEWKDKSPVFGVLPWEGYVVHDFFFLSFFLHYTFTRRVSEHTFTSLSTLACYPRLYQVTTFDALYV